MKNIQPRAELPLVHMAQYANAMPARPPKGPVKNLTGLYLGVDGGPVTSGSPRGKSAGLTPLARGRGMPSSRVRTPTEHQRYKKVELLRMKEEKRGFSGQPLKRKSAATPQATTPATPGQEGSHRGQQVRYYNGGVPMDVWDITKQTTRHFTAATNSGVTHLEYLSSGSVEGVGSPSSGAPYEPATTTYQDENLGDTLAQQVHQMAASKQEDDLNGLVDCYRKVCKGSIDALYSLMPQQRPIKTCGSPAEGAQNGQRRGYTGFSVKSYRNPNKAEIIAQFPPPVDPRPRALVASQRPLVPSPYFFKSYSPSLPRTAIQLPSATDRYTGSDYSPYHDSKIIVPALPGGGQLSRSVSRGRQNTSPRANTPLGFEAFRHQHFATKDLPLGTEGGGGRVCPSSNHQPPPPPLPTADNHSLQSSDGGAGNEYTLTPHEDPQTEPLTPRAGSGGDKKRTSTADAGTQEDNVPSPDVAIVVSDSQTKMATSSGSKLERMPSGADIMIGLEDEAGTIAPVEIDEADELIVKEEEVRQPTPHGRRVSITERVLKSKNSEMQLASITMTAQSRKQQLAELLDEHAQLVTQVSVMEDTKAELDDSSAPNSASHSPTANHHSDKENTNGKH